MAVNEDGVTLETPVKIGMHYLRSSFITDFISSFPFEFWAFKFFSISDGHADGSVFNQQLTLCNLFACSRLLQVYKVNAGGNDGTKLEEFEHVC